jgi:hypothetical protein
MAYPVSSDTFDLISRLVILNNGELIGAFDLSPNSSLRHPERF